MINLVLMLEYKYNARLLLLIKYCIYAASFDVFDGPMIYEKLFKFRDTRAFNTTFELFGFDSMNFIMNSASLPIFLCLLITLIISIKFLKQIAKKLYTRKCCRQLGMYAQGRGQLCSFLNTFLVSNFLDLSFSVSLYLFAIYSFRFSSNIS